MSTGVVANAIVTTTWYQLALTNTPVSVGKAMVARVVMAGTQTVVPGAVT